MRTRNRNFFLWGVVALVLVLVSAACNGGAQTTAEVLSPEAPGEVTESANDVVASPTASPSPAASPTPTPPPELAFLATTHSGPAPENATARLGRGKVEAVAFSPDGSLLAVGSSLGIWLYDAADLSLLRFIQSSIYMTDFAFSPDGSRLASPGPDGDVYLWDVQTGEQVQTFNEHPSRVIRVAYSPEGSLLAGGDVDGHVHLWDVQSGAHLASLEVSAKLVVELAFSPDGGTLAAAGRRDTISLWDVQSFEELWSIPVPAADEWSTDNVASLLFSPDGATLIGGLLEKAKVVLLDPKNGQFEQTLESPTDFVTVVAVSPDGNWGASGSAEGTIILWDLINGEQIGTLEGHQGTITALTFSPDSALLISASTDGKVLSWSVPGGEHTVMLEGFGGGINNLAFSPDGKSLLVEDWGGGVALWDIGNGERVSTISRLEGEDISTLSPTGDVQAVMMDDYSIILRDPRTGEEQQNTIINDLPLYALIFSGDGRLLAGDTPDWSVAVWDVQSGDRIGRLEYDISYAIDVIAFSPDGSLLAAAEILDPVVLLWDVFSSQLLATLEVPANDGITALAFTPDNATLLIANKEEQIIFLEPQSGEVLQILELPEEQRIYEMQLSPDGGLLAVGTRVGDIFLWDMATNEWILQLPGHVSCISSLAFAPHGGTLASGSCDGTVLLWDVASLLGRPLLEVASEGQASPSDTDETSAEPSLDAPPTPVPLEETYAGPPPQRKALGRLGKGIPNGLALSPDGRALAVASSWGVWIYDAETLNLLRYLPSKNEVANVQFSPDGKVLAAGSLDETILWDVDTGESLQTLEQASWMTDLSFSPDGEQLVGANMNWGGESVYLWRKSPSGLWGNATVFGEMIYRSVAFSPDGRWVAGGSADPAMVTLWDVTGETPKKVSEISAMVPSVVVEVVFSPEGENLAMAVEMMPEVGLYDVQSGQLVESFPLSFQQGFATALAFSPDGSLFAGGTAAGDVLIWDVSSGQPVHTVQGVEYPFRNVVQDLVFTPDGETLFGCTSTGEVIAWDVQTGEIRQTLGGFYGGVGSLAFADNTTLVSAIARGLLTSGSALALWDLDNWQQSKRLLGEEALEVVAVSPDGSMAAASAWRDMTNYIVTWDTQSGEQLGQFGDFPWPPRDISFSPDGTDLALVASDVGLVVLDPLRGQTRYTVALPEWNETPSVVAYSPDGGLLAVGADGLVTVLDAQTQEVLYSLPISDEMESVMGVAFSSDGSLLAAGSYEGVRVWDMTTGEVVRELGGPGNGGGLVAFSPDGRVLVSSGYYEGIYGKESLVVWDAQTWRQLMVLTGHQAHRGIQSLAFSPDGSLLASGGLDGSIVIWDMAQIAP